MHGILYIIWFITNLTNFNKKDTDGTEIDQYWAKFCRKDYSLYIFIYKYNKSLYNKHMKMHETSNELTR